MDVVAFLHQNAGLGGSISSPWLMPTMVLHVAACTLPNSCLQLLPSGVPSGLSPARQSLSSPPVPPQCTKLGAPCATSAQCCPALVCRQRPGGSQPRQKACLLVRELGEHGTIWALELGWLAGDVFRTWGMPPRLQCMPAKRAVVHCWAPLPRLQHTIWLVRMLLAHAMLAKSVPPAGSVNQRHERACTFVAPRHRAAAVHDGCQDTFDWQQ